MAKTGFSAAEAFENRRGMTDQKVEPATGEETVTKSIRFRLDMWAEMEAAFRARGLNASNGIRQAVAEWLQRDKRNR